MFLMPEIQIQTSVPIFRHTKPLSLSLLNTKDLLQQTNGPAVNLCMPNPFHLCFFNKISEMSNLYKKKYVS